MTTITAEVRPVLLSVLASLGLPPHSCVYVSTPISTGLRYLRWREGSLDCTPGSGEYVAARQHIKSANRDDAKALIILARSAFNDYIVIDPTALADVEGWQQCDYHLYWIDIITNYVHTVIFADGWQYSEGCAIEFATAAELGIEVIDHMRQRIDAAGGLSLIEEAIDRYMAIGVISSTLSDVAARLRRLSLNKVTIR
jgi:hypothetical protein